MNNDKSVAGIILIGAAVYFAYLFTVKRLQGAPTPTARGGGLFGGSTLPRLAPAPIEKVIPRSPIGGVFTPPINPVPSGGIRRLPAPPAPVVLPLFPMNGPKRFPVLPPVGGIDWSR